MGKVIIKSGEDLIFNTYLDKQELIVNLNDKWIFNDWTQKKKRLYIYTSKGTIILAFSSEISKFKFQSENKDQLIWQLHYHQNKRRNYSN